MLAMVEAYSEWLHTTETRIVIKTLNKIMLFFVICFSIKNYIWNDEGWSRNKTSFPSIGSKIPIRRKCRNQRIIETK